MSLETGARLIVTVIFPMICVPTRTEWFMVPEGPWNFLRRHHLRHLVLAI